MGWHRRTAKGWMAGAFMRTFCPTLRPKKTTGQKQRKEKKGFKQVSHRSPS